MGTQGTGESEGGVNWETGIDKYTLLCITAEKALATHSSVLAWRIPETGEPGGLPSMRSHRVGHD